MIAKPVQLALFTPSTVAHMPFADQINILSIGPISEMPMAVRVLHHADRTLQPPPYTRDDMIYGTSRAIAEIVKLTGCSAWMAVSGVMTVYEARLGLDFGRDFSMEE